MKLLIATAKAIAAAMILCIPIVLSSFSSTKGGEGFEIYLNNKLVLQQFGSKMSSVKSIRLDQRYADDQLIVKYYHCGHIGKNRSITIKNTQNKILKEWKFANTSAAGLSIADAAMACKVKDILRVKQDHAGQLSLHYTSSELPEGRLLANLTFEQLTAGR